MKDLQQLKAYLRDFAEQRDWQQYHSPKNLAMALTVEAAELLEQFQWLSEGQSKKLSAEQHQAVSDEIADIQVYLVRLADQLDINILEAVAHKTKQNEQKYPADQVRGRADKYTFYQTEDTKDEN
ncbi:MAG: nucleotide pyrophosphohydrolase [Halopseudomonas sp.]